MDDNKFWVWMAAIGAAVIFALVTVICVVNAPDWALERELLRDCAKRGGVRLNVTTSQPGWRDGCFYLRVVGEAP